MASPRALDVEVAENVLVTTEIVRDATSGVHATVVGRLHEDDIVSGAGHVEVF